MPSVVPPPEGVNTPPASAHSAEMVPTRLTFHGLSASRRTSRRIRYCQDWRHGCVRQIDRGGQYVRAVMFPNHDASGYDRPVVMVICLPCAAGSELAPLVPDPLTAPVKRTCPTCHTGLDTAHHHAECVAPLDQLDGGA